MTEEQNIYMREWNRKNKLRVNTTKRDRYKNDPVYREKMILRARNYRKNNKEKKSIQNKEYKTKHIQESKSYARQYFQDNPEKFLESNKKHYETIGKLINLDWKSYKWKLLAWSKAVRKRDNSQCQICPNVGVHAHHILPKAHYPELSLNINNGITLCMEHHKEVHGRFT